MRIKNECYGCLKRQIRNVQKITGATEEQYKEVADYIDSFPKDTRFAGTKAYNKIRELTGIRDPYKEIKRKDNELAFELLPKFKDELEGGQDKFKFAVRVAIAGNIIDYGAPGYERLVERVEELLREPLLIDDVGEIKERVKNAKVLYIHDNAGEIVFDKLLIKELKKLDANVTSVVRGAPAKNDALMEDAEFAKLASDRIITTGTDHIGVSIEHASREFNEAFNNCDIVVSKGQGNLESLYGEGLKKPIAYLLTIKCMPVAKMLSVDRLGNIAMLVEG